MRQYQDADGNPIALCNLVRREPDWATNNIERLERENGHLAVRAEDARYSWELIRDENFAYNRRIVALEAQLLQADAERDRLRAKVGRVERLLAIDGCSCECEHRHDEHHGSCECCLACQIEKALGGQGSSEPPPP